MAYRLLIVDDEKEIVESLTLRLKREGYEVSTAFDGEEALQKLRDDNPDLVILDLMLPKLNGFEVLERMRKEFIDKWRPVIIISAKDEFESWRTCYDLEADLYLVKPCTIDDILRGITTMISLISIRKPQSK